jgi:hypothetical protein
MFLILTNVDLTIQLSIEFYSAKFGSEKIFSYPPQGGILNPDMKNPPRGVAVSAHFVPLYPKLFVLLY